MNAMKRHLKLGSALLLCWALLNACQKSEYLIGPKDSDFPAELNGLQLESDNGKVIATWDALADDDIDYLEANFLELDRQGNDSLVARRYAADRVRIEIGSLRNFREYRFRFYVVDLYGNRSDSVSGSAMPLPEVLTLNATGGPEDGSVLVTWQDPPDPNDQFAKVRFYDEAGAFIGEVDKGTQRNILTGYASGAPMRATAKVQTVSGSESKGITFNGVARAVLPPPAEVSAIQVKSKSGILEISWANPDEENFHHNEVWWGPGQTPEAATNRYSATPDTLEDGRIRVVLGGLTDLRDYAIVIKTSDEQGNVSDGSFITAAPENTTYVGHVSISSQADADAFDAKYTYIVGNVSITATDLTNLRNFANVDSISGQLTFTGSSWSYTEMHDFASLQAVGGVLSVSSVWTSANLSFPELRRVGGNFFASYIGLKSIVAPKLQTVGGNCYFLGGAALQQLSMGALQTVSGYFVLGDLPSLTNLDGLASLRRVGGNFHIGRDPWGAGGKTCGIADFCGVTGLFQSGTIGGSVMIEACPYNPTTSALERGECRR